MSKNHYSKKETGTQSSVCFKEAIISEQHLKSFEESQEHYLKESERLESMYKTLASHSINDIFKQQITKFYQDFTIHLNKLLVENSELKEMLKALYNLHVKEVHEKECSKENFEGGFNQEKNMSEFKKQIKRKYKNELVRVREVMGNQIKKLENELMESLQQMKQSKKKNDFRLQKFNLELENEKNKSKLIMRENVEREIMMCKETLKNEFCKEKTQLLEKFEVQLRDMMIKHEKESKEYQEKIEKFQKICDMLKIENENREYELETVNENLERKDTMIEELNQKLQDCERVIEKLKKSLERKEDIIDKQTNEVKKLIQNLQEKKFHLENKLQIDYQEIQKSLEFQIQVVKRLELENQELKEKNEFEIEMMKQKYERKIEKLLSDKNSILEKRNNKAEQDMSREIKEYLRIIKQKDKIISKLRDEKLKTRDQLVEVRDKLIQQDQYIKKQDLELLNQKQEFQSKILTLEKDILEFAKVKEDIIELKRRSAKKNTNFNSNNSSNYTTHQTVSTFSSTKSKKILDNSNSRKSSQGKMIINSNPYTTFARKSSPANRNQFPIVEESGERRQKLVEEVLRNGDHLIPRKPPSQFPNKANNTASLSIPPNNLYKDPNVTQREEKIYLESKLRKSHENQKSMKNTQSSPVLRVSRDFENRKVYHPKPAHPGFNVESIVNSTHPLSTFHNSTMQSENKKYGGLEDTREGTKEGDKILKDSENMIFADEFELENIGNSANFDKSIKDLRNSEISFNGGDEKVLIDKSNNGKSFKIYGGY